MILQTFFFFFFFIIGIVEPAHNVRDFNRVLHAGFLARMKSSNIVVSSFSLPVSIVTHLIVYIVLKEILDGLSFIPQINLQVL